MAGGRPTDYKKEYCEEIIDYLSDGKHPVQFAAKIGVSKATLYKWATEYPEFSDALEVAKAKSLAWWVNLNQETARGVGCGDVEPSGNRRLGNANLIQYTLAVKDKEFRKEKPDDEEKKKDVIPVTLMLSNELLTAMAKELADKSK